MRFGLRETFFPLSVRTVQPIVCVCRCCVLWDMNHTIHCPHVSEGISSLTRPNNGFKAGAELWFNVHHMKLCCHGAEALEVIFDTFKAQQIMCRRPSPGIEPAMMMSSTTGNLWASWEVNQRTTPKRKGKKRCEISPNTCEKVLNIVHLWGWSGWGYFWSVECSICPSSVKDQD